MFVIAIAKVASRLNLHVSLAGAVWTVTAYLLTASAGTPLVPDTHASFKVQT